MAINKVLLAKQINGVIEYLYPKTSADQVLYTDASTNEISTVQDEIASIKVEQLTQNNNIEKNTDDIAALTKIVDSNTSDISGIREGYETQNDNIEKNADDIAAIKAEQLSQNTAIEKNTSDINILDSHKISMPVNESGNPVNGNNGQILRSDGNGSTSWVNYRSDEILYEDPGNLTVHDILDNLNSETFFLRENKVNMPNDEDSSFPTEGYRGQILQSNGDGTTSWVDYIPNGLSAIRIVGTNDGGEWGYINYNDRYQSQIVQVSNYDITPNSQITIQFTDQQAEIFEEKYLSFLPEVRTVSLVGPNGETEYRTYAIVYACGDIPENSYTLQVTVSEVA